MIRRKNNWRGGALASSGIRVWQAKLKLFVPLILVAAVLTGCSTANKLSDIEASLNDIQKGISAVFPKGIAKISSNRRTYSSKYFDPESIDADRSTEKAEDIHRERATAIATIYGDSRPYDVVIDVLIEEDASGAKAKKDDDYIEGRFEKVGYDKSLAIYFKEKLATYLARLEKNKNLIDDFRPF